MLLFFNALYFIPAICSLLWVVMLTFLKKNQTQRLLLWLLLLCTFYYITYALYISPWTDYDLMVRFSAINMPVSFAIFALNLLYILAHHYQKLVESPWRTVLFIPSLIYLLLFFLIYTQIGFDQTARLEELIDKGDPLPELYQSSLFKVYLFADRLFNILCFIGIVLTVYVCMHVAKKQGYKFGDAYRFFTRSHTETTPARSVCLMDKLVFLSMMPIAILGRSWMFNHPICGAIISVLTATLLFFLCYVEFYSSVRPFNLFSLAHINLNDEVPPHAVPASEAASSPTASTKVTAESTEEEEPILDNSTEEAEPLNEVSVKALAERIRDAFLKEHIYLDQNLSVNSLSERLGTNRTTLSMVINQFYGMPFRNLVSYFRVEAAKNYMLQHPDATQDTVASECGFSSAQAFNLKFKQVTGLPPRIWLTNQKG